MIKLSSLITEVKATIWFSFTLSDKDPWEYYCDKATKIWYTRKKGKTQWIDMKSSLSPENFKIAIDNINKGPIYSTDSNMEKWQRVVNVPDKQTAEFKKSYVTILDIASELLDITTNNPGYYFSTFAGSINDDESGAANWFANYYNTRMLPKLHKIELLNNTILTQNIKNIHGIAQGLADAIKKGKSVTITLPITDPNTKKTTNFKMFWNYM